MLGKLISEECDTLGVHLIRAYGALSYADARAVQGYTGDAEKFTKIAIEHLRKSGIDEEDLEPILEPLKEITGVRREPGFEHIAPVRIASRIDIAQEELLRLAPSFIIGCECKKRK